MKSFTVSKKVLPEIADTPMVVEDLLGFHNAVASKFIDIWAEGEENEQRFMGNNWLPELRKEIEGQGRNAYSIPIAQAKVRHISSAFRQVRTSHKVEAKSDPADEPKAQIAQLRLRDIEKRSVGKFTDVDVFDSGVAIKYGVKKIDIDDRDGIEKVVSKVWDYRNFVWDLNSTTYDYKESAMWCAEVEQVTKSYLRQKYPNAPERYWGTEQIGSFSGRDKISYFVRKSLHEDNEYDLLSLFTHYHKVTKDFYCVLFPDSANLFDFTSPMVGKYKNEKDAKKKLGQLNKVYFKNDVLPEGEIVKKSYEVIDKYVFTCNNILEYEETDLEYFPYDVYFSIRFADKFISFMDFLKSPQLIIDRMWSQIDYTLGKDVKNAYQGNANALADDQDRDEAVKTITEEGGVIWTKTGDEVFRAIQRAGTNPEWTGVIQIMMKYLEDFGGGQSFQGLNAQAKSGKAVINEVMQGQMVASAFFDAFNRFKRAHGKNLLSWLKKYDDEEGIIKIHGGALSEEMVALLQKEELFEPALEKNSGGYVRYNVEEKPMSYLKDADLELEVIEEGLSETERDRRWLMLTEAERADPLGALQSLPSWFKLKLEAMDIDPSTRQILLKEYAAKQEAMAQQAKQDQDIEKAKVVNDMAKTDAQRINQLENAGIKSQPNQQIGAQQ